MALLQSERLTVVMQRNTAPEGESAMNKKWVYAIISLLVFCLGACSNQHPGENKESGQSEPKPASAISFAVEGGGGFKQFSVILLDAKLEAYMKKAREADPTDARKLYEETVFKPVWNDCFAQGEYLGITSAIREQPPSNFARIEKAIALLRESDEPDATVTATIKDALMKSAAQLEGPAVTNVCVLPTDLIETSAGYTVGSGKILLLYNPYLYKDKQELAGVVAHEYHHSAWTSKHFQPHKPFTLLDYLAFEGKAVAFSQLLYPNEDIIDTYPDDEQVESRRAMLQHLDSTQLALQQKIMFGGQDGIPQVFGYSEGYRLVQTFLRDHPDLTVEQWTASSPEELLREVQTSHPEFWR